MVRILAIWCALITGGHAQTGTPGATPVTPVRPPATQAPVAAGNANSGASTANPSAVGMDQPVITLKGGCEPTGYVAPSKGCVSSVTRAEFEKLTHALQPDMTAEAKRGFAANLGRLLVYSNAARALHLENDPNVQEIIQFITDQVLAEGLKRHYTEQFSHPSEQQIEAYYNQNSAKYLEATLQRINIPIRPAAGNQASAQEAQANAEKIRQRWLAGEDPVTLQKAAYETAGSTGAALPDINLGARRPGSLPANQEAVFQLKAGEISQAYTDPAGLFVYKVVSVRQVPIGDVKDSIVKTLRQQQLQDKLDEVGKSASPVLNEEYFGPAPAPGSAAPGGRPSPAAAPPSANAQH
jgi:hypothetical protein